MSEAFSGLLEPSVCESCPYTECPKVLPSVLGLNKSSIKEPAKLVIVGEGAGAEEEKMGVGFVGASGQLMFNIFGKVFNENMPHTLVTNAVWCRPPDNETPNAKTLKNCAFNYLFPLLLHESIVADDAIIVCVGKSAWTVLHNMSNSGIKAPSILTAHGYHTELTFESTYPYEVSRTFQVFPMIHPAYVLRAGKPEMLADDVSALFDLYFKVPGTLSDARKGFEVTRKEIQKATKVVKDLMTTPEIDALVERIYGLHTDESLPPVISFDVESRNTKHADISNYLTLAGFGLSESEGIQFIDTGLNNIRPLMLRFRDEGFIMVGQNIYFDLMMLFRQNIIQSVDELPWYFDTMIMHHIINENSPAGLKFLLQKYCGWPDYGAELEPHLKEVGGDYGRLPLKVLLGYHALDICGNIKLFNILMPMVYDEKVSGYWLLDYLELTHTLDRHLLQAAMNGLSVDREVRAELAKELMEIIERTSATLDTPYTRRLIYTISQMSKDLKDSIIGSLSDFPVADALPDDPKILNKIEPFNPGSTQQLTMLLASTLSSSVKTHLKKTLGATMFTEKGKVSVADDTLSAMLSAFDKLPKTITDDEKMTIPYVKEVIGVVKEYRSATKLNSTYIDGMLDNLWPDDRVRAHWKVTGTVTGRLSCTSPNLQNIPREGVVKVKDMFVVNRPGYIMMNFDLSQAEMRGLASVSGDEGLAKSYREGLDVHKSVGSMIFNKPYDEITKAERQASKPWGFGAIYGAGPAMLGEKAGITKEKAREYLSKFFAGFPKVQPWIEEQHRMLKEHGYVVGVLGRKRNLPHSMSKDPRDLSDLKREAQNAPIQQLASDFNLLVVRELLRELKSGAHMIAESDVLFVNTVHDSTMWEVGRWAAAPFYDLYMDCLDIVNGIYRDAIGDGWVDMASDCEIGMSWGKTHPLTRVVKYSNDTACVYDTKEFIVTVDKTEMSMADFFSIVEADDNE